MKCYALKIQIQYLYIRREINIFYIPSRNPQIKSIILIAFIEMSTCKHRQYYFIIKYNMVINFKTKETKVSQTGILTEFQTQICIKLNSVFEQNILKNLGY